MRLEHRIPSVQPATNVAFPLIAGQKMTGVVLGPLSEIALLTLLIFCTGVSCGIAQDPPGPNEQFIPADQLDTVFDRDRRGVMMKRAEFRALLEQARAHAAHGRGIQAVSANTSKSMSKSMSKSKCKRSSMRSSNCSS